MLGMMEQQVFRRLLRRQSAGVQPPDCLPPPGDIARLGALDDGPVLEVIVPKIVPKLGVAQDITLFVAVAEYETP
jgi:hypothetical protein